ncbi:MAG: four-carbon acid sugar kinase family protein [Treponema sp.]|jgi:uncharacterized protein YgbK (DUF1537 family)|nr:four-carbon acid sugar kinase family protein [Treponema sp.]
MCTLLILADDLTGALDTGVQFSKGGISTLVSSVPPVGGAFRIEEGPPPEVLVINTDTRHCSPERAGALITEVLEKYPAVPFVYKKTDSTLRGHIGAELEALVLARKVPALPFIPAYPRLGRTTRQGRQYLEGVPVDRTAADALNPVRRSFIPDIIAEESTLPVRLVPRGACGLACGADFAAAGQMQGQAGRGPQFLIYDAEDEVDLRAIARSLKEQRLLGTCAGCAGFAGALMEQIPFARAGAPSLDAAAGGTGGLNAAGGAGGLGGGRPVLIITGSRHPVSLAQVRTAMDAGTPVLAVEGEKLLGDRWFEGEEAAALIARCGEHLRNGGRCILGTRMSLGLETGPGTDRNAAGSDAAGSDAAGGGAGAAGRLGKLLPPILAAAPAVLAVFGGDTLLGVTEALGRRFLRPLGEIRPGLVLASCDPPAADPEGPGPKTEQGPLLIAAKSGAFGEPDLIGVIIGFFGARK